MPTSEQKYKKKKLTGRGASAPGKKVRNSWEPMILLKSNICGVRSGRRGYLRTNQPGGEEGAALVRVITEEIPANKFRNEGVRAAFRSTGGPKTGDDDPTTTITD